MKNLILVSAVMFSFSAHASTFQLLCQSSGVAIHAGIAAADSGEATLALSVTTPSTKIDLTGPLVGDAVRKLQNRGGRVSGLVFGAGAKTQSEGVMSNAGIVQFQNISGKVSVQVAIDGLLYFADCK